MAQDETVTSTQTNLDNFLSSPATTSSNGSSTAQCVIVDSTHEHLILLDCDKLRAGDESNVMPDLPLQVRPNSKLQDNTPPQESRKRRSPDNTLPQSTSCKHPNTSSTPPDTNASLSRSTADIETVSSNQINDAGTSSLPHTTCRTHTLLIRYREAGKAPLPSPLEFQESWDGQHVRMPCSAKNLHPLPVPGSRRRMVSKWSIIESALQSKISNSQQLEEAILRYNPDAGRRWNFSGLHAFFSHYATAEERKEVFDSTIPGMSRLALNLPTLVTAPLPLLRCEQSREVTLSQVQVACLLANAFFCTFPRRNATGVNTEYANFPSINMHTLFGPDQVSTPVRDIPPLSKCRAHKLRCLFHYFKRVLRDQPTGCVTFRRQQLEQPFDWSLNLCTLAGLQVENEGRLEDTDEGTLKVDFANKIVGGGVLRGGCVQEEIYFLICPELILSRLFVECLEPHEAVVMVGAERYSDYSGYSDTFEWSGDHYDVTPVDPLGRRRSCVAAIDALIVRKFSDQFRPWAIRRELDKALAGFLRSEIDSERVLALATGNWGCGAFGGDKPLKCIIQLMAAAVTKRDLIYFTFGDKKLGDSLKELHELLRETHTPVGALWSHLCEYNQLLKNKQSEEKVPPLFQYLTDRVSDLTP